MRLDDHIAQLSLLFDRRKAISGDLAALDQQIALLLNPDVNRSTAKAREPKATAGSFPMRKEDRPPSLVRRVAQRLGMDESRVAKVANGRLDTPIVQKALLCELENWKQLSPESKREYSRHLADREFAKRFADIAAKLPLSLIVQSVAKAQGVSPSFVKRVASGTTRSLGIQRALISHAKAHSRRGTK